MPDKTTKKHKHLTLDEREEIQGCLNHGITFKAIGQRIGKDQTTVSKEVKRHLVSQALEHRAFDREMIEDIYAEKFKNDREDGAPPIPSRAAFAMNAAACLRALARWLFGRIVIVWGFSGEPK